jgi:hypothetical protein
VDLDFEQGSDSDEDFDANELLDLKDYKPKREETGSVFDKKPDLTIKDVFDESKRNRFN